MNKYEALVCTGKLEVLLQGDDQAVGEVKQLQKSIAEDDYTNAAISFGKISVLYTKSEVTEEVGKDMSSLYEYITHISKKTGKAPTDMSIDDMDLSARCYNCIKRAGINTLGDILAKSEEDFMKIRNFGRKPFDELIEKVHALGYIDFPEYTE